MLTLPKSNVSPHHTMEKSWKMRMMSTTWMKMPVTCLKTQVSLFSFLFLYFTNNYLLWTLQVTTVTTTIARCSSKERPTMPAMKGGDWGMGAGDSSGSRCVDSVISRAPKYLYIFFQVFTLLLYSSLFVKSNQIILLNLNFK